MSDIKPMFTGDWLSACCGAECEGKRNDQNQGRCCRCKELSEFIEYYRPSDAPLTTRPYVQELFNCIERLQDIFNACNRVGMSEVVQIGIYHQVHETLVAIISNCLRYIPPKDSGGSIPPVSDSETTLH